MNKTLKLSLVIPVYNEESRIKECLDAISGQTVKPYEVILVDNNCSDASMDIASRYSFVRIVKEPRQGMIPARNRGFDSVRGDVIGRIDVDTILSKNWVKQALKGFEEQKVMGLAGLSKTKILPINFNHFYGTAWNRFYYMWREARAGTKVLWGANMAIRKSAWLTIREEANIDEKVVHEDQDLSYLMSKHGLKVRWRARMLARTNEISYHYWPKFKEYYIRADSTYALHKSLGNIPGAPATHLNIYQRGWRYITVLIPALFFIFSSYVLWKLRRKTKV